MMQAIKAPLQMAKKLKQVGQKLQKKLKNKNVAAALKNTGLATVVDKAKGAATGALKDLKQEESALKDEGKSCLGKCIPDPTKTKGGWLIMAHFFVAQLFPLILVWISVYFIIYKVIQADFAAMKPPPVKPSKNATVAAVGNNTGLLTNLETELGLSGAQMGELYLHEMMFGLTGTQDDRTAAGLGYLQPAQVYLPIAIHCLVVGPIWLYILGYFIGLVRHLWATRQGSADIWMTGHANYLFWSTRVHHRSLLVNIAVALWFVIASILALVFLATPASSYLGFNKPMSPMLLCQLLLFDLLMVLATLLNDMISGPQTNVSEDDDDDPFSSSRKRKTSSTAADPVNQVGHDGPIYLRMGCEWNFKRGWSEILFMDNGAFLDNVIGQIINAKNAKDISKLLVGTDDNGEVLPDADKIIIGKSTQEIMAAYAYRLPWLGDPKKNPYSEPNTFFEEGFTGAANSAQVIRAEFTYEGLKAELGTWDFSDDEDDAGAEYEDDGQDPEAGKEEAGTVQVVDESDV